MSMKITQVDGWKLKAEYDGVTVISGQVTRDSDYEGFSPGKLMVAGLGMCTGMHAVTYLTKHKIEYSDLELELTTEGAGNPARYAVFNMSISVKADLSEEHYKGLVEECNRCFVGNTMTHQPEIKIDIKTV
jgi:uncharacterized OsmC-like protein